MMSETWLDGKNWLSMKSFLQKGYAWRMKEAKKEEVKRRAISGMVSGVRREVVAEEKRDQEGKKKRGQWCVRVKIGKEIVAVVCVYTTRGEEESWNKIKRWTERKGKGFVLIGGYLNAWTGVQGGEVWGDEREVLKRKSKHKEIDQEGKKLLNLIGETGWFICNGNSRGDEEGEITFTGRGDTVIDYILAEERIRRLMVKVEVGNEIGSEHFPVVTTLRTEGKKRDRRGKGKVGERKVKMGLWGEEKLREYREKIERENVGSTEEEGVDEMIIKLKEVTDRIREEVRPKGNGEAGRRGWWDEECG